MVARRAIWKSGLLTVVFSAVVIPGRWAGATEHGLSLHHPQAGETMVEYCERPRPTWYFGLGALALKRDGVPHRTLASRVTRDWVGTTDVPPVWTSSQSAVHALGPQDLDFGHRGGWEALIGRMFGERFAFEISYSGLSDWEDSATIVDQTGFQLDDPTNPAVGGSLYSPFTDPDGDPVLGLDYNTLVSIAYSSDFHEVEWNLRRHLCIDRHWVDGSVLIGGRYISLRERFSYYSESDLPAPGGATNAIDTSTANKMVGVQVGAEFNFQIEPRCWIDCEIKGGIFNNAAKQNTVYEHQGVAAYAGTHVGRRAKNTSAFALDLSLDLTYQCNSFTTLQIGYQALWLDGVALASENVSSNVGLLTSGYSNLNNNGDVVYHGPRLGINFGW